MIKIENKKAYSSEGLKIRRKGTTGPGNSSIAPVTDASLYEEVTPEMLEAERIQAEKDAAEKARRDKIAELVDSRYPLREEVAIQRQRESNPEKFRIYDQWAEACKKAVNDCPIAVDEDGHLSVTFSGLTAEDVEKILANSNATASDE